MITEKAEIDDLRVQAILDLCIKLMGGDLKARGTVSERHDNLDAIVTAINMLADEMEASTKRLKEAQNASLNIMEDLDRESRRLDTSLREREVLLQELHHRVKNNLQVIMSMMRLQARIVEDEKTLYLLKDIQSRIETISLIHEKLYRSRGLAEVVFKDYVNSLAQGLIQTYGVRGRIVFRVDAGAININMDKAIPCGLILNELISNSIKYAFPEGRTGEIRITVQPVSKNELELLVSDNGIGIPGGLDIRNTKSLGMQLVTALVEDQLKGSIEINRDKGTEFRIKFKI